MVLQSRILFQLVISSGRSVAINNQDVSLLKLPIRNWIEITGRSTVYFWSTTKGNWFAANWELFWNIRWGYSLGHIQRCSVLPQGAVLRDHTLIGLGDHMGCHQLHPLWPQYWKHFSPICHWKKLLSCLFEFRKSFEQILIIETRFHALKIQKVKVCRSWDEKNYNFFSPEFGGKG